MRGLLRGAVLGLPLLLAGCGGGAQNPTVRDDETWDQFMTAGEDSFALGRYSVAATQYRKAADLALVRDSAPNIAEAGYDLAVSQLAANQPAQALASITATRQAVALRQATSMPFLDLVEAAARYRLGQYAQAQELAAHVMAAGDGAAGMRAALVAGLAADKRGDATGLSEAQAYLAGQGARSKTLSAPQQAMQQAALSEIQARALRASDPARGRALAEHAAALLRDNGAYRDMSRVLALAAELANASGDQPGAKALWARAAQSAAAQNGSSTTTLPAAASEAAIAGSAAVGQSLAASAGAANAGTGGDAASWGRNAGDVPLRPFDMDNATP
ncbi:hypothetical protein K2X14_01615 [Acetobacter sp. TBRC 12305]|uniref:Uncharacterized protein n=1 Tax=Acetobacter garciniae TaxID=2817435 RepID=A0A939HJF5_9PROT|nr:hypothetical protein [Acetobacter garciniae]MBX0343539.1 hypothetical protein [Acetobacter garciniae]